MQGLCDGYFVAPYTVSDYLASVPQSPVDTDHPAFADVEKEVADRVETLLSVQGDKTPMEFHRELGQLLWDRFDQF